MEVAERIAALSDFAAVAACQDLAAALAMESAVPLLDAVDALPSELTGVARPEEIKQDLEERYHLALPPEVAIPLSRAMLAAAAANPALAPILARVLDESRDTRQFALEVLALGAALSMVIVAATSSYDKDGFAKGALSPELARELGSWLDKLRPWRTAAPSIG